MYVEIKTDRAVNAQVNMVNMVEIYSILAQMKGIGSAGDSILAEVIAAGEHYVDEVESSGTIQVSLISDKGDYYLGRIETEGTSQYNRLSVIGDEQSLRIVAQGDTQYAKVHNEGEFQYARLPSAADDAVDVINATGNTQIDLVASEGSKQYGIVNTEGINQYTTVHNEGEFQYARLPASADEAITDIVAAGDYQFARLNTEGDTQENAIIAQGIAQNTLVISQGNAQDTRVIEQGDTQDDRITAAGDAVVGRLDGEVWEAEAEALTSASFATEPENVEVKKYTSNNDGTFSFVSIHNTYSSLHWAAKGLTTATAINYVGVWDASQGVYPTTKPPEGTGGALESQDMFVINTNGTMGGINWFVRDWMIRNSTNTGWNRVPQVTDWGAITGVPDNVANAVGDSELQAGLAPKADITYVDSENALQDAALDTALSPKADTTYVDSENALQDATIAAKPDKSYVDDANNAQDLAMTDKADISYVDSQNTLQNIDMSYKATIGGFLEDGKLDSYTGSLNDISINSTYTVESGSTTNGPVGQPQFTYLTTFVASLGEGYILQVMVGLEEQSQWVRRKVSTWGEWVDTSSSGGSGDGVSQEYVDAANTAQDLVIADKADTSAVDSKNTLQDLDIAEKPTIAGFSENGWLEEYTGSLNDIMVNSSYTVDKFNTTDGPYTQPYYAQLVTFISSLGPNYAVQFMFGLEHPYQWVRRKSTTWDEWEDAAGSGGSGDGVSQEYVDAANEAQDLVIADKAGLDYVDAANEAQDLVIADKATIAGFPAGGWLEDYSGSLNDISKNSTYTVNEANTAGGPADQPTSAMLVTFISAMGSDYIVQIMFGVDGPFQYMRRKQGSWGEWTDMSSGGVSQEYVDAANEAQDSTISSKAATSYVIVMNEAQDEIIANKADTNYVNSENNAQNTVINSKLDSDTAQTAFVGTWLPGTREIQNLVACTSSEYDALTPLATTLYVIIDG